MKFADLTEKQQMKVVSDTGRTRQAFTNDPSPTPETAWEMYLCSRPGQELLAEHYGTRPIEFDGTVAESREHFDTHRFGYDGDDVRCVKCDCKDWHAAASYPCGQEPPREFFNVETGESVYPCMPVASTFVQEFVVVL